VWAFKCGPYPYAKASKAWASFKTISIGFEREATLLANVYLLVISLPSARYRTRSFLLHPFPYRGIFPPVAPTSQRSSAEPRTLLPPSPSSSSARRWPRVSMGSEPHDHPWRPPSSSPAGHPRPQLWCGDGRDLGASPSAGANPARAHGPAPARVAQLRHGRVTLSRSMPSTRSPSQISPSDPGATVVGSILHLSRQQLWI
jgi:hypothetical protein